MLYVKPFSEDSNLVDICLKIMVKTFYIRQQSGLNPFYYIQSLFPAISHPKLYVLQVKCDTYI